MTTEGSKFRERVERHIRNTKPEPVPILVRPRALNGEASCHGCPLATCGNEYGMECNLEAHIEVALAIAPGPESPVHYPKGGKLF